MCGYADETVVESERLLQKLEGKPGRSDNMVGLESVKASTKETVYESGRMKVNL